MKTECPYCGQHYDVEDHTVGKKAQCVTCKREFYIGGNPDAVLWEGRPSLKVFAFSLIFGGILAMWGFSILVGAFFIGDPQNFIPMILIAIFFLGGALFCFLYSILTQKTTSYSISRKRISYKSGILSTEENYLNISDIRNINISQSIIGKIVGCGDVNVSTAATTTDARIPLWGLRDFRDAAKLIEELRK